jgi:hypothetical protein
MSDLIRTARRGWLPPPGNSVDPKVHNVPDHYSFVQNQIESEQRQAQRNMNRTVRAGRQGTPRSQASTKTPFGFGVVPVLPLGVTR